MFPYPNKYIEVSDKTPIKDIGYAFLDSGFRLKLYHGITNGICGCWKGVNCKSPGKQPLFGKKGMTTSHVAFDNALIKYPNLSMGVITGWNPEMEKQLVVIDFDNKSPEVWNEVARKLPSLLLPTFTEETLKGKHYWFWAPEGVYISTNTTGALAYKVDVLSSTDRGVLTIGSPNKVLLDNSPIAMLSAEECIYLHNITDTKKRSPVVKKPKAVAGQKKVGTKFSEEMLQNQDAIIGSFYSGKTQHGQYYHTFILLLGAELRRNYRKYKNNVDNFVDWSISKAKNHLQDADIGQVEDYARSLHKNYDESQVGTPATIFDKVFKGYSSETRELLATIFQYGFIINGSDTNQGTGEHNCATVEYSSSIKSLQETVYAHLKAFDQSDIKNVFFTPKQFVIFLSQYHPGMKKKEQSIYINGKRSQPWLWNLSPVSHIDLLNSLPQDYQGTGEHNCATPNKSPNKYVSIFTQDNTITISTVEQEPKTMTKTELMAQRLMSIYNTKSIQQEPITSTAVPPVEYVKEAKVEDVKVCVPKIASSTEAPVAFSAYNKTLALLESLRMPPKAYTDKVEQAFDEAGFF